MPLIRKLLQGSFNTALLLTITLTGFSQSVSPGSGMPKELPEIFFELAEARSNTEECVELWKYYQSDPLNINQAKQEELEALGILTPGQIRNLLKFRDKHGDYVSVRELRTVPGFSDPLVNNLQLIFAVTSPTTQRSSIARFNNGRHWFLFRGKRIIETAAGYRGENPAYAGNPWKLYTRYRYSAGQQYSIGYTLEKDAGESFFSHNNQPGKWYQPYKGFDFHSAHLYWRPETLVKCIALGDFSLNAGEGLVLRNGFSFGKSVFSIIPKNHSYVIRPYTSAAESSGLRGAALQLAKGPFSLATFYSRQKKDATLKNINNKKFISALPASGLHRTPSEINKKNNTKMAMQGLHGSFQNSRLEAGITLTHSQTSLPVKQDVSRPEKHFRFNGQRLLNAGFNYSFLAGDLTLNGEIAANSKGGHAQIHTLSAFPGKNLDLSLSYRNYAPDYHSFFALPFGETGKPTNEKGLYAGWVLRPADHWELKGYTDIYRFPWLRHRTSAPSRGREHLLQLSFYPETGLSAYIRWKAEQKQINRSGNTSPYNQLTYQRTQRARINLKYPLSPDLKAQSRIAFSAWQEDTGYMLFQDLQYHFPEIYITLTGRLAWYHTPSFQSAIYAYENDVLYSFSIKPYYLQGTRSFLLLKYHANSHTDIWLRWAATQKPFESSLGSGYARINGSEKHELTLQLMLEF